jgi:large-conductance mechanosensitive channel
MIYLILSIICVFQRYIYNNHTILQLIIGFIIGSGFGIITYKIGRKIITGNITMKKDDYGPL